VNAQFVAHDVNRGVCRTINEAYALATGRYVACLAADDAWLPEKLAHQVAALDALPEDVAVLYGDALRVDEHGTELPQRFLAAHGVTGPPPEGDVFARLLEANFVPATTAMLRRSATRQVGAFDERLRYEDWDYLLRLARDHRFAYVDYVGTRYRVVRDSLTRAVTADLESHARIMRKCLGARPETDSLVRDRLEWMAGELLRTRPSPRHAWQWAIAKVRRYARRR
jgi:glycosyltransferase involved in cell wall biosynthesis